MKIYITRQSAGSVMAGGLDRLDVWFTKPIYIEYTFYDPSDLPFGNHSLSILRAGGYWQTEINHGETKSFSFGKVFGYSDSKDKDLNIFALFVWEKLKEHFQYLPIQQWEKFENDGNVHPAQFFLEINMECTFKNPH